MNDTLKMGSSGLNILKEFEKCVLTAYDDNGKAAGGVWTIGWGNTEYNIAATLLNGRIVKPGDKVMQGDVQSQEQADAELIFDLVRFENEVKKLITVPINNNQFDSLVDFCYNNGGGYRDHAGIFHYYDLFHNINVGMPTADLFTYWIKCAVTQAGVPLAGLVRRRKAESTLFNTGVVNYFR